MVPFICTVKHPLTLNTVRIRLTLSYKKPIWQSVAFDTAVSTVSHAYYIYSIRHLFLRNYCIYLAVSD